MYESAIAKGLQFLAGEQRDDGGFVSFSSFNATVFNPETQRLTTFFTSVICDALRDVAGSESIIEKGHAFLRAEKQANGSWNYWSKHAPEFSARPYPSDLDDTCYALLALGDTVEVADIAAAVKLLTLCEIKVGGPYHTWVTSKDSHKHWKDCDLAVNATVARFLKGQGVRLPNLHALFEKAVRKGEVLSQYYHNDSVILSFLARAHGGKKLVELLQNAQPDTPQDKALVLIGLAALGLRLEPSWGKDIAAAQNKDGSWPVESFCIDPAEEGRRMYAGAAALTTALCLQALSLFRTNPRAELASSVVDTMRQEINVAPREMRPILLHCFKRIVELETKTPVFSLGFVIGECTAVKTDPATLRLLGSATAYGWIAYTLIDATLDGAGTSTLPAALWALRRMQRDFAAACPDPAFTTTVSALLDRIDAANQWEVSATRFNPKTKVRVHKKTIPNYGNLQRLADRSIGHALGALAIFQVHKLDGVAELLAFFEHFLILRQLSDDLLDWQEDARAGSWNSVGALLLRNFHTEHGDTELSLSALIRQLLRHVPEVLPDIHRVMRRHLRLAKKSLTSCSSINDPAALGALLDPFESILNSAHESAAFHKAYSKT